MLFKMVHENYNVFNLEKSLAFYKEALGMKEKRRHTATDGSCIIIFVGSVSFDFELELTWLKSWDKPYNLGDCEFHLAFKADDFKSAHELHEKMGCICFENTQMGIYFIKDPDGYWLEIVPTK